MIFIDFFVDDYRVFFFLGQKNNHNCWLVGADRTKKKGIEFENVTHYFILTL
jgi:hypothetical protein